MFVGWKRGRILRDEKAAVWSRWLLSWWVERRQYNNHWRFCFGPLALPPSIQPAAFFFFRYVYLRVGNPPRTRSSLPCVRFAQSLTEDCVSNVSVSFFFTVIIIIVFFYDFYQVKKKECYCPDQRRKGVADGPINQYRSITSSRQPRRNEPTDPLLVFLFFLWFCRIFFPSLLFLLSSTTPFRFSFSFFFCLYDECVVVRLPN